MVFTPRLAEQSKGSGKMRKTLLFFVTILFFVPLLSGCCPYWYDGGGRGYYGHDRGYDRGYGGQRNGGR
jgi:hypothetical protein